MKKVKYFVNFVSCFTAVDQRTFFLHAAALLSDLLSIDIGSYETSSFPFNIIHQRNFSLKMAAELAPKHDPDRPPCSTVWLSPNPGSRDCQTDCENTT